MAWFQSIWTPHRYSLIYPHKIPVLGEYYLCYTDDELIYRGPCCDPCYVLMQGSKELSYSPAFATHITSCSMGGKAAATGLLFFLLYRRMSKYWQVNLSSLPSLHPHILANAEQKQGSNCDSESQLVPWSALGPVQLCTTPYSGKIVKLQSCIVLFT